MRQRCWWRTLALTATFACGGSALAHAQEYAEYAAAPAPETQVAETPAQNSAEFQAILDRLDRQQRELDGLRGQLDAQKQTPAKETGLADLADEKKADDKKAGDGPCKKVELIVKPKMEVFGRIFFDQVMFEDDPALSGIVDRQNETGFSTFRLGAKGTVYENITGQVEVEFEGSETDIKDTYIGIANAPVLGNIWVGHFKEPMSLEELTSDNYTTFMQRSLPDGTIIPSRNFGVMAFDYIAENDNWSWFAGTFRHDSPDNPVGRASHIDDAGDWVFTSRLAGLLFYDEPSNGRYLLHVGGSYSNRHDLTVVSFSSRPELGSQAGYLTSTFAGDRTWDVYGLESSLNWGSAQLQAEFYSADPSGDPITGGYVQTSYFLTGEHRPYRKDYKVFDRVKPIEDFFRVSTADGVCMGRGAWELKARYSWLDMTAGTTGTRGNESCFDAGVNWYWNPYTRMMFEYLHEDVNLLTGVDGANDNFGMRFQIDF